MHDKQKLYKQYLERTDKNFILKNLHRWHNEAEEKNDCLACAACCKHYSPRFKLPDIKRISKALKLKESIFIEQYLLVDNEGDFVVKSSPCPFLMPDNYCSIYEIRPSDCKRFPYTDEDVIVKRKNLTIKNATFCGMVEYVLDRIGEERK